MFTFVALVCLSVGLASGARLPGRIVGGDDTDTGTHPHQVSLEYGSSSSGFSHICGASMIGQRWILTAAHCVEVGNYDPALFRVAFNNGKLDDPNRQHYYIVNIIHHEDYNPSSGLFQPAFPNDIALLELDVDIISSTHQAIELVEASANLDHTTCTISGWGYTVEGDSNKDIPNTLQETTGVILNRAECESQWNTAFYPSYSHAVHICIHDDFSGSCNGDSGGPMVCAGKLAGVTSWGAAGCTTTLPSVYVRVQNYRSWIAGKINA